MNFFWEHTGNLIESGLYPFSGVGNQEVRPWFMRSLCVTFSGNQQFNAFSFTASVIDGESGQCLASAFHTFLILPETLPLPRWLG